jgi:hypothetical protein
LLRIVKRRQRTIDADLHKIQEASQAITPRKTISNAPSGKSSSRSCKYLFVLKLVVPVNQREDYLLP